MTSTISLRPYQTDLIDRTRAALRTHKRVLLQLPTGGGKTLTAAFMVGAAAMRGKRIAFLNHRNEILDQSVVAFTSLDIPCGVIAAGYPTNLAEPIQVCSIDTLRRRMHKLPQFDFLIVDECQHAAARTWLQVLAHYPNAHVVGLSATPLRLDGKGLGDIFQSMVCGPTVAELMAAGFLAPFRAYAPTRPDLSGVHTKFGDFVHGEIEEAMDRPSITGDAIAHYQRLAPGKRAVVFCASVAHSQHVAASFQAAGISAAHLDGGADRSDRRATVAAFRRGDIRVLSNVDLFGEGFDLPELDCSILLRPTQSLALAMQQIGRALRPKPDGSPAIILDHAGNLMRHGLPDMDREWSLEARKKRRKAEPVIAIRTCPQCLSVHRPAPTCPHCGFQYEAAPREIEQRDGELAEMTASPLQAWIKSGPYRQVIAWAGGDEGKLRQIAKARGYRPGWTWHQMLLRRRGATDDAPEAAEA